MDGHHEHRSSDGSTYSGEWRQGMRWGQGTQTYALTGNVYSGAWVDGRWHGYGELKLASGCCYRGERYAVAPARLRATVPFLVTRVAACQHGRWSSCVHSACV